MATPTQIRAKVRECVSLAKKLYGFDVPYSQIDITFKSKGQAAAQAWRKGSFFTDDHTYGMKFSTESAKLDSDEMLNDTVPHEVAHLVCFWNDALGNNHDSGWKRVCIALGGTGARTHNQTLTKGRYRTQYVYKTDSGIESICGAKKHNKIQRGAIYRIRSNGEVYGKSHFHRVISPEEHRREHMKEVHAARASSQNNQMPETIAKPKKPKSNMPRTITKKVQAQALYDVYKHSDRATIITMFMKQLNMTKAGASTYYANCKRG